MRGHPGDFDSWAEGGATGWSYAEVLPYFRESEGLTPSNDINIDGPALDIAAPLGFSVRPAAAARPPIRRGGRGRWHPKG